MRAWLWMPLVALAAAGPARAGTPGPILHELIPPDAREDLAMHVLLDGDLPAAIQTPSGVVSAPDPRAPASPADNAYGASPERSTFQPDRDTKRPEVESYDEPFTPSTAPFKRLEAFDAVLSDYHVEVRDSRLVRLAALQGGAPPSADEDAFYADLVVDVPREGSVRIPSVGPGARVVRARLGIGETPVPFQILRDGADNWFLQPAASSGGPRALGANGLPKRARLVMEVAIARAAFGGAPGDVGWSELPFVPPLPDNVARDAAEVRAAVGVSRAQRPRDALGRLVQYFRGFADSDEPPQGRGNVYLDLALSKKGVCRHRAFAFLVTAQSLGIPTRLVENEAHAWVEVHDGSLWKRVDLGGAGHMTNPATSALPERTVYRPPQDPFAWPQNAERGDDMVADARARAATMGSGPPGPPTASSSASTMGSAADGGATPAPSPPSGTSAENGVDRDERPASSVVLSLDENDAHRGLPLHVRGEIRADGEPCPHVAVEVWLRDATARGQGPAAVQGSAPRQLLLGALATGDDGTFRGGIVVPGSTPLGDYDVVARTPGDARCGAGASY